ncbi:MAG: hypothetical protein ACKO96_17215, partial [Flammeovirgaceae bacterium]
PSSKMGKRVIAEDVYDAEEYKPAKELTAEEALSMPAENLKPLNERTMETKKYKLPDGQYFWSDGLDYWIESKSNKKRLTRNFIEHYNNKVSMMDWFLPDWYSVGKDSPDVI